jgi:hypothetical protein
MLPSPKRCRNKTVCHVHPATTASSLQATKKQYVPLATTARSALATQSKIHAPKAPIVQLLDSPIKANVSHVVLAIIVPPQRRKSQHLANRVAITTTTCKPSIVICARQVTHATSVMHTLSPVLRVTSLIGERQSAPGVK